MKDELITILEQFGYPVFLQGSLLDTESYPDAFFTFWNNNSEDLSHYDNEVYAIAYDYDVNFYATDPELIDTVLKQAKTALQNGGWIITGNGIDMPSGNQSHTGRGFPNILYVEVQNNII